MRAKPKVPRKWLKDPAFARPKKEHANHPFGQWSYAWPYDWDARHCTAKNCRCMHWCCYQQRKPVRRVRPDGHRTHRFGRWLYLSALSPAFEIGRSNRYKKCRDCGGKRWGEVEKFLKETPPPKKKGKR